MISDVIKARLDRLFAVQDDYHPDNTIAKALQTKDMIMLVGATAEGKNTAMDAAATIDNRFKIVGTFTSRAPRDSDDPSLYTYYDDSDEGLMPLLARIDSRQVVQYAINPHAHLIYGSELSDYRSEYNLGDIFSNAVTNFRQLGFRRTVAITVITAPDVWLRRFEQRFPMGHPQRQARRDEAIESFTWSLNQGSDDHFWAANKDGQPNVAGQTIINITLGASEGDPMARSLAAASLDAARMIDV